MARIEKRQRQKEQRRLKIEAEIRAWNVRRRRRLAITLAPLALLGAATAVLIVRSMTKPEPSNIACGGAKPTRPSIAPVSEAPALSINQAKTYTASIQTSCGTITLALEDDRQPVTVNSFVYLARRHFFDGLTFHRVVEGFAVQGGDPKGDGTGGPGYSVTETPSADTKYLKGTVAMAKSQDEAPGTSGSQFFIVPGTEAEQQLGPDYSVLGHVVSGADVLDKIQGVGTGTGANSEKPSKTIYIDRISIAES
ncbi:MAG: peptidylprolyl isomerase [Actinomycetota bacterium]